LPGVGTYYCREEDYYSIDGRVNIRYYNNIDNNNMGNGAACLGGGGGGGGRQSSNEANNASDDIGPVESVAIVNRGPNSVEQGIMPFMSTMGADDQFGPNGPPGGRGRPAPVDVASASSQKSSVTRQAAKMQAPLTPIR